MDNCRTSYPLWRHGSIEEYRADEDTHRLIHLVRLAWDIRAFGFGVSVVLPRGEEMFVRVPGAADNRRIMATCRDDRWLFTWGHSSWVDAYDDDAAMVVLGGMA